MFSLFLDNNRQHFPVCAKMISSRIWIVKAYMSVGTFWSAVASLEVWCLPGVHSA